MGLVPMASAKYHVWALTNQSSSMSNDYDELEAKDVSKPASKSARRSFSLSLRMKKEDTDKETIPQAELLDWNYKVKLTGEKKSNKENLLNFCEKCKKPIMVHGRLIPCKHFLCLNCAQKGSRNCYKCDIEIKGIQPVNEVYICTYAGTRHSVTGCRKSYLNLEGLSHHQKLRHSAEGYTGDQDADSDGELSVKKQQQVVAAPAVPAPPPPAPAAAPPPTSLPTPQQFMPQLPQLPTSLPTSIGLNQAAINRVIIPSMQPVPQLVTSMTPMLIPPRPLGPPQMMSLPGMLPQPGIMPLPQQSFLSNTTQSFLTATSAAQKPNELPKELAVAPPVAPMPEQLRTFPTNPLQKREDQVPPPPPPKALPTFEEPPRTQDFGYGAHPRDPRKLRDIPPPPPPR